MKRLLRNAVFLQVGRSDEMPGEKYSVSVSLVVGTFSNNGA